MTSIYRQIAFVSHGLLNFTRGAYQANKKKFDSSDYNIDISNRIYMVTGSNSGIGYALTSLLLKHGATVHMVCRNRDRAEKARDNLLQESKAANDKIIVHVLDISNLSDVKKFTSEFKTPLNCLINNAGCMVHKRNKTEDGFDVNFATNVLGTFALTEGLKNVLSSSGSKDDPARVITVSSGGMLTQNLDLKDIQSEKYAPNDATYVYAQQKRQQVCLTEYWASENTPNLYFQSVHPGWADTEGVRSAIPDFRKSMGSRLRTADEGADGIFWLAIAKKALSYPQGEFFLDRLPQRKHLPLAWTHYTFDDVKKLYAKVKAIVDKIN